MTYAHDKTKRPGRVREPVQVYLDRTDQEILDELTAQLETSKSEVLRHGLSALKRELADPQQHPALKLIGIAGDPADRPDPPDVGYDVAVEHDRYLADTEVASWDRPEDRDEP